MTQYRLARLVTDSGTVLDPVKIISETKRGYWIEHKVTNYNTITGAILYTRDVERWYWKSQVTPHD